MTSYVLTWRRNKMKGIVLSFFDYSTIMVQPWAEAGYECYCFDIKHAEGFNKIKENIIIVGTDIRGFLSKYGKINCPVICFFFPPCTDLAVSGARWFKMKGAERINAAKQLFMEAAHIARYYGAPYMIENPVGIMSTYYCKPDHYFQPWEYGDNYTKKTCLWTGNGFIMPEPKITVEPADVKHTIHRMPPSPDRADKRSLTPIGFAEAVFEANCKKE